MSTGNESQKDNWVPVGENPARCPSRIGKRRCTTEEQQYLVFTSFNYQPFIVWAENPLEAIIAANIQAGLTNSTWKLQDPEYLVIPVTVTQVVYAPSMDTDPRVLAGIQAKKEAEPQKQS